MKQQQLTDLALRKVYHAEMLGMPTADANSMRAVIQDLNAKIDHAARFIDDEATMLNSMEKTIVLERGWNEFVLQMTQLSTNMSEWIRRRVASPGGLKAAGA
ncbi:hypothetical protein ACSBPU_05640 [Parapusillimonas sp. JC17]|uniref:hypothetical protein n=1 Tax=Parapusillimonas sp. JC17 TaxID=3445768 RepID=UPI003FA053AB